MIVGVVVTGYQTVICGLEANTGLENQPSGNGSRTPLCGNYSVNQTRSTLTGSQIMTFDCGQRSVRDDTIVCTGTECKFAHLHGRHFNGSDFLYLNLEVSVGSGRIL